MFRVIAGIQIIGDDAVKTCRFSDPRYLGDPLNIIKILNEKGAQEFLITDLNASKTRKPNFRFVEQLSSETFVPFAYGGGLHGGINTAALTRLGVERFIVNTCFVENISYVENLVSELGTSSVSLSLDLRSEKDQSWVFVTEGGRKRCEINPSNILRIAEQIGIGEVVIKPIDFDGAVLESTVESYRSLLNQLGLLDSSHSFQLLLSGGIHKVEQISQIEEYLPVQGVVLGSMISFSKVGGGVLVSYPSRYSVKSKN